LTSAPGSASIGTATHSKACGAPAGHWHTAVQKTKTPPATSAPQRRCDAPQDRRILVLLSKNVTFCRDWASAFGQLPLRLQALPPSSYSHGHRPPFSTNVRKLHRFKPARPQLHALRGKAKLSARSPPLAGSSHPWHQRRAEPRFCLRHAFGAAGFAAMFI
jgi:hypothetical protein